MTSKLTTTRISIVLILTSLISSCMAQKDEFKKRNVAVFLYDGVEILDFGGPAEVFAATGTTNENGDWKYAFNVYTVAASPKQIISQGFLKVTPDYTLKNCPVPDIIVFPGGSSKSSRENPDVIRWIKECAKSSEVLMSVCTGAFLLGDSGLLEGLKATTWWGQIDRFRSTYSNTEVLENVRFVDNGQIVTTAGVSAGIDGALHVVSRMLGKETAEATAKYMEYDKWEPDAGIVAAN